MAPSAEKPPKIGSCTSLKREDRGGFLGDERKQTFNKICCMPKLPRPLDLEEKKYMLAVEKGDIAATKRIMLRAKKTGTPNVNCRDPFGRTALNVAIDAENLSMLELLVVMGVEPSDALLHAISVGFVEGVELLLEYEEIVHQPGEPYSWEKVERNIASYTPDITPLILAAHKNNYEILKLLIDRGATIPMPHDIRCACEECVESSANDSLRHSMARINAYRALASPSLIALSSTDPILTAFELSWELKNLAYTEHEFKTEYTELRRQCMFFAESLLNQTRSSQELAIILNYDPNSDTPYQDGDHMKLARLELAIAYKQKKFVAHPHIQQLLASLWYDGLPGFRRKSPVTKAWEIVKIAVLFPYYCAFYMIAPGSTTGKLMKKPFMKFLIHSSSYLFFLFLLILMSQRVEQIALDFITGGYHEDPGDCEGGACKLKIQRGLGPTVTEVAVFAYVMGFVWEELKELYKEGLRKYLNDLWNAIDVGRNVLYLATVVLRVYAYIEQNKQIEENQAMAYLPRELWHPYDAQLISEGLCAAANVLSALKLVHMFSINPYLGPLQVSLGRMVIDIIKFILIYTLVLFAFACGMNQLLWYYAELEKQECFSLPGGLPDWTHHSDECMNWRRFANLFESTQSLFWATFGLWGLEAFYLKGIQSYTRFWAMLMFGCYSVINVVVLLNLLIAMMSHSFTVITEKADSEWKFARTELWLKYFEPGSTLPPPFNLLPSPKTILRLFKGRPKNKADSRSSRKKDSDMKERDYRHMAVMRALVWRYIIQQQRQSEERGVTEDDISEVKNDISSMRCEMLEVLGSNGFDVSHAKKSTSSICRKSRVWERRLLKDFHVSPIAGAGDKSIGGAGLKHEGPKERFRRAARTVIGKQRAVHQKWALVVNQAQRMCHIGSTPRNAVPHRQSLKKAMEEATKLVSSLNTQGSPLIERPDVAVSPVITTSETEGRRLLEILRSPMAERGLKISETVTPQPTMYAACSAGHASADEVIQQLAREAIGTFLTVPQRTGAIFDSKFEHPDSDEDSRRPSVDNQPQVMGTAGVAREETASKTSAAGLSSPEDSPKDAIRAKSADHSPTIEPTSTEGSLPEKSVSLMNFDSPSPKSKPHQRAVIDANKDDLTTCHLDQAESSEKVDQMGGKSSTAVLSESKDQAVDSTLETLPPLPSSDPPHLADECFPAQIAMRKTYEEQQLTWSFDQQPAMTREVRRESEVMVDQEVAEATGGTEDEEEELPQPDVAFMAETADLDEGSDRNIGLNCHLTRRATVPSTPISDLGLPRVGPRNLRKPSTSSLEQVIVRQDTNDELHLDMNENDGSEPGGCGIHPEITDSPEGTKRDGPGGNSEQKQHRFQVTLLQQAASDSTEYLIPPAGDQGAIALTGMGDEAGVGRGGFKNAGTPSPAVYRSEWTDVNDRGNRRRQKEREKNFPGGGWL